MRILQVITLCELGGAQSVVVNLANKLSENHEVIVAAGEGDGKVFELLKPEVKTERVPNLVHRISPTDEVKALMQLRALYRKYHPDIIHLHSSKAGMLGRIAFPKSKIVYTVHGFDSIRVAHRKLLPVEKFLQNRCSAIAGVSNYDENNLRHEGITKNVTTVYNGIYPNGEAKQDILRNINRRKGLILCIARLSPQKKHQLFLEVAERLPQYSFAWIGNQNPPDFDYPENVYFLGNIPNAGSYCKEADLFMLPSNYEGLPMVIIEALSSGTPVVASNVGGISELLDGTNGMAVENDATKMAQAIEKFMNSSDSEKGKSRSAAIETYNKDFTVEKMTKGYESIYERILTQK